MKDEDGELNQKTRWFGVEPGCPREIGEFNFSEGMDGFMQVFAAGSEGEVLAYAVRFKKINKK